MSKNSKIFFIGSNGRLILAENPNNGCYIFGKPNIKEFLKFKKIIDKFNLIINKLIIYISSHRTDDIKLKENILLKLPLISLLKILITCMNF